MARNGVDDGEDAVKIVPAGSDSLTEQRRRQCAPSTPSRRIGPPFEAAKYGLGVS
jgi:hypothetical protein